jgi:hypothetical protein
LLVWAANPARGGLFIGQNANPTSSFCFSAARRLDHFRASSMLELTGWKRNFFCKGRAAEKQKE